MRVYRLFFTAMLAVVVSSCNIDETITAPDVDKYYRAATAGSLMQWSEVFEYTPAPGQFIGDTKTGGFTGEERSAADAVAYAERRLAAKSYVSLGGFGGYIVVGFDHSIDNNEGYDFAVQGNSFDGSSEPGVVWVMRDENGNGQPDDTWYELAGSETGKTETIQNYAVTYYRPSEPMQPVQWTDNQGNSGEIDYLKQFHKQDYYYPAWIEADSYTLTGTMLKARNYDKSGNGAMWVQPAYDWGYADNASTIDCAKGNKAVNTFDISKAVDASGNAVALKYIDFVKVQTACNTKSGWLGENSTEIFDIYDL